MKVPQFNSIPTILIISAIITICLINNGTCQEEKTCKEYITDYAKTLQKGITKCIKGESQFFKQNSVLEIATRATCLLKCNLQEQGVIDEEGQVDQMTAALIFLHAFPEQVRNITIPLAKACAPLTEKFDPNEVNCKSYLPFIQCSLKAILKGLIPYGADCVESPTIRILFSIIKFIAYDSPDLSDTWKELTGSMGSRLDKITENIKSTFKLK